MSDGIDPIHGYADNETRILLERLIMAGYGIRMGVSPAEAVFIPTTKGNELLTVLGEINRTLPGLTPLQIVSLFALAGYRVPDGSE